MANPQIRFKKSDGLNYKDWENKTFADYGKVAMCRRVFKDETDDKGDVPFYKIGTFGGLPDAYISRELFEDYKKKYPYPTKGAILISASGTIGRIVKYEGKNEYFQDSNIVWLDHNDNITDAFLEQLYAQVDWYSTAEGNTIKRLYNSNFLSIPIVVPELEEQTRIANFLTEIDNLIKTQTEKVEGYKRAKKSMMQKLFTRKVRYKKADGSEYDEWVEKAFLEMYKNIPNKQYQIQTSEYKNEGVYKVIDQGQNIVVGYSNDSTKVYNSVPVIIYGDHTTIVKYVDEPFIVGADGTKMLGIFSDDYDIKFLYYALDFNNIKPEGYKRHFSTLKEISFSVPKSKAEQVKIANCLSEFDKLIKAAEDKLEAYKELKKCMLQKMFV